MLEDVMQSVYDDMPDPIKIQKAREENKQYEFEFQRLCYEIFLVNPDGKRLYELLKERFLIQAAMPAGNPDPNLALYLEGMREVVRGLATQGNLHRARSQRQVQDASNP